MLLGVTQMGKKYYNMIHTDFTLYNQKKCLPKQQDGLF